MLHLGNLINLLDVNLSHNLQASLKKRVSQVTSIAQHSSRTAQHIQTTHVPKIYGMYLAPRLVGTLSDARGVFQEPCSGGRLALELERRVTEGRQLDPQRHVRGPFACLGIEVFTERHHVHTKLTQCLTKHHVRSLYSIMQMVEDLSATRLRSALRLIELFLSPTRTHKRDFKKAQQAMQTTGRAG